MDLMPEQEKALDLNVNQPQSNELAIKVGSNIIDLSGLNKEEIAELKKKYINTAIDIEEKRATLKIEVEKLDDTLASATARVGEATQRGDSMTVSHVETTSTGKTEFMVGNTEQAASGKLPRSVTGENYNTFMIVIVIVMAIVIAVLLLGKS